ncbi:MAG TPA: transcriptional repressor [Rhodospirillaceae bacterium]|jgi:Fur family ferric uptake transcriptional regulator|nr:transcriptional repressor [Rhodospirillaceae bacterium]|tara:strand:- start:185 stop:595 length:411 start_codon:yes stop_codon:yes gene_type:complete
MKLDELEQACSAEGLKMTGQRKIILKILSESDDHPSVDDMYARAKAADPSISMATVYRTLNTLDELGLVTKHEFKEGFARFETNTDHHHHMIDVDSGDVIEFQNAELEALKEKIAEELGYELVDHNLELYGRKIKG